MAVNQVPHPVLDPVDRQYGGIITLSYQQECFVQKLCDIDYF